MPPDTEVNFRYRELLATDQLVDEMIFKFTHTVADGLDAAGHSLPPAKRVEVAIGRHRSFSRGDKLGPRTISIGTRRHSWCNSAYLTQIPYRSPVSRTARKVVDNSLPSNALMQRAGPLEN